MTGLAFLDAYVLGQPAAHAWLASNNVVVLTGGEAEWGRRAGVEGIDAEIGGVCRRARDRTAHRHVPGGRWLGSEPEWLPGTSSGWWPRERREAGALSRWGIPAPGG
jgi:hypothetical protein